MVITLQTRNTITIPLELRKALGLEPGDPIDARVEKGRLVLAPVSVVPRALCLSPSGEAKEAEAEADIEQGRISEFGSAEALIRDLEE